MDSVRSNNITVYSKHPNPNSGLKLIVQMIFSKVDVPNTITILGSIVSLIGGVKDHQQGRSSALHIII